MSKIIHLISDLHLAQTTPSLMALFQYYMEDIAPKSQQLFVLGDLFDVWVGDDNESKFTRVVASLFRHYSEKHGELFICHGNRDFLIGRSFAKQCGATLIEEPYNFNWLDTRICLMHGDSLCVDDVEYQNFRKMVRTQSWQREFLSLPVEKRLEIAKGIKKQSKDAQKEKATEIMDVNCESVIQCFRENQNQWLIHGHTHREGHHQVTLPDQSLATRIVLSDWTNQGQYLELKEGEFKSHFFELSCHSDSYGETL